jgi:hypothetical protein
LLVIIATSSGDPEGKEYSYRLQAPPLASPAATPYDSPAATRTAPVTKDELTAWALANGWQILGGYPSLTKPSSPKEAIVRLALKATVATLEVKRPAGKWDKVASEPYARVMPDPDTGIPLGLGFEKIPSFTMLMQDNKDRQVFTKMTGKAP